MIVVRKPAIERPKYLPKMTVEEIELGHRVGHFRQDLSISVNAEGLNGTEGRGYTEELNGNIINGLCCVAFLTACGETLQTAEHLLLTDWQRVRGVRPKAMHMGLPPRRGDLWTDPYKIFSRPQFSRDTHLKIVDNQTEKTINVLMWVSPLTHIPQIWGWCYYEERTTLGEQMIYRPGRQKPVWAVTDQSKLRDPHELNLKEPLYNLIHDPRLKS